MTPAELDPAFAALAAKKQRLRESFDRLAASSPVPIPFRWEDIDAHLSSVQSAIALRFRQLDSASPQPAVAAGGPIAIAERVEHPVEHLVEEDPEPRVERGVTEVAQEGNAGEVEEAKNANFGKEAEGAKGEVGGASDGRRLQEGGEAGNERGEVAIEASPEQDDEDEASKGAMEAMPASPHQGDDEVKMVGDDEAGNASAGQEGEDDEAEEGEAKWPRPRATAAGGGEKAMARSIAAACENMDASTLVDALFQCCRSSLPARRAFLPALLGAADPHALVVHAVGEFLARPARMTYRSWGNCVALLDCVPHLTGTVGPSADTLEQAERLALEWKEMMVGKTGSCRDISRLAGWGLFTFLASYNVVLEFEAEEIIRLFDNIPPDLKDNCIKLCKHLGLIEKMTDSIHHLIRNGQLLDAIRLACALNLTDKCPPLSVMYDYVEKAKKTAEEILSKGSDSAESLNQVMEKNVNALILSWTAVDQCNIDSFHRNSLKEEISQLLHKYADKQQNLAGVSAFVSTSHQQHNLEGQHQLQRTMAREEKQRKAQELQEKPGEKRQRQQHKTHESQPKQLQNQEERGRGWQNLTGRRPNKNQKRKQRRQDWQNPQPKRQQQQQQFNKRPRFSSYSYSGIRGVPFADRATIIPP